MKAQYHLDFAKFSLQKFKESLQTRNIIPSRRILKQDIEKRFKIFDSHDIKNLKELVETLKSNQKIESFSEKTGLSVEYLTILKREVNSYLPNPISLRKLPGIDTNNIESLEQSGIKNTKQFFNHANCDTGIHLLAQKTGLSVDLLNEIASLSDLVRLYGVGPIFARIIFDVGITSIEDFVRFSGKEFIKIYEKRTNKKADFSEGDINFSLEIARELLSLVED